MSQNNRVTMRKGGGQCEGGCDGYETPHAAPADEERFSERAGCARASGAFPPCLQAAEAEDDKEPSAYDRQDDQSCEFQSFTQVRSLKPHQDRPRLHAHQQKGKDVERRLTEPHTA